MQNTMKGMVLTGHGGMEMLKWKQDIPVPIPKSNEVLIKVNACGLNNTDVNTRIGWYALPSGTETDTSNCTDGAWGGQSIKFPRIQGADICGTVISVGNALYEALLGCKVLVEPWIRDDADSDNLDKARYLGSEIDGGFAEYVKVPQSAVYPIESTFSDIELATFATSYITAENMLDRACVTNEDQILITGASGGVGSALIQLAQRRGAKTIALSSRDKAELINGMNPDAILFRESGDLKQTLLASSGLSEVSVVADVVGGPLWQSFIDIIARGGRYVCSGAIASPHVSFDLRTFYLRDLTFLGATVVPKGTFKKLIGYIERKEIKPIVAATYALSNLGMAQKHFLTKNFLGNIVVTP